MTNIVLIGMPGCGKSAIAKEIEKKTGRRAIDTDAEIEKSKRRTIAEIIGTEGEKRFREAEKRAIREAARADGAIVACGGGAVEDEENMRLLKRNGVAFYIVRDLAALDATGRILSDTAEKAEALFGKRRALYERYADYAVTNDSTAERCASEILATYEKNIGAERAEH